MNDTTKIEDIFQDIYLDIDIASQGSNPLTPSEYIIETFSDHLIDEGYINDIPDITRYEEGNLIAINGYYYEDDKDELHLFIVDVTKDKDIIFLNNQKLDSQFNKLERFYTKSKRKDFVIALPPFSPGRQAAEFIFEKNEKIKSIQLHFMTTAAVGDRLKIKRPSKKIEGEKASFNYNLWDLSWYYNILESNRGVEDLILHIPDGIECLKASAKESKIPTYLACIKGNTIADWFSQYGDRLVESNVRTYLQARGKVNKEMIRTIKEEPEKFLSYNNGLTASCSKLRIKKEKRGGYKIEVIENLQIVNGGQTSGTLLQAKSDGADLDKVWIQMKISEVDESDKKNEDLIQNISKYSNLQNPVNPSDFISNSPFNKKIQQISKNVRVTDTSEGKANTFWFYERIRGQYNNQPKIGASRSEKNRFKKSYPPSQKLNKLELAKYYNTFESLPHFVSLGAAKNLTRFDNVIKKITGEDGIKLDTINDQFYKDCIAKAIIYRMTDKVFLSNKLIVLPGGFKSQTVNYTLAWFVNFLSINNLAIDYQKIWREQAINKKLIESLMIVGKFMNNQIVNKQPGRAVFGIPSEYAKTKIAADSLLNLEIDNIKLDQFSDYTVNKIEENNFIDKTEKNRNNFKEKNDISMELVILQLENFGWITIREIAQKAEIISIKQNIAVDKFLQFGIWDTESDKDNLINLYENIESKNLIPEEFSRLEIYKKYNNKKNQKKG